MAGCPLIGLGLVARKLSIPRADVVFLKAVLEASEGLGAVFADKGGDLFVAAPTSRAAELDQLLADLAVELELVFDRADDRTWCCAPPLPSVARVRPII